MKTTKKDVQNAFERFTKLYNLKTSAKVVKDGNNYYSNSFIKMDFNSTYGGYRLDVVQQTLVKDFSILWVEKQQQKWFVISTG